MAGINSADIIDFTNVNSKMPYLDATIMEINRLYPVVHSTVRIINRETVLTSSNKPVVLKPDMLIYLSCLHINTSPDLWGLDAGEFVPERCLDGYKKDQPFMSFGYGPRNCVRLPAPPPRWHQNKLNIIRLDTNLLFLQPKCIS